MERHWWLILVEFVRLVFDLSSITMGPDGPDGIIQVEDDDCRHVISTQVFLPAAKSSQLSIHLKIMAHLDDFLDVYLRHCQNNNIPFLPSHGHLATFSCPKARDGYGLALKGQFA